MAMNKEKAKGIKSLIKDMNKLYGEGALSIMADVEDSLTIRFHKTPSHEINAMLGGGFVRNKIIELYGLASSGKTSLALEVIASEQRANPDFVAGWLETEGSLDIDYIKSFGIDTERLAVISQSDALSAEKAMEILRALINSNQFDMIVLNSVAGLLPSKEVTDALESSNVALTARLLSRFFRVVTGMLTKTNTTLVLINQVRTGIGQGGPVAKYTPMVSTGGMAIPFYATQRIEMRKAKILAGEPIAPEDGVKIVCKTVKNRVAKGNPYKTCEYYAVYGKGIDGTSELPTVLAREGILDKTGGWYKYLNECGDILNVPTSDGEVVGRWNGLTNFVNFLRENPETRVFFEKLLDKKLTEGYGGISVDNEEIEEIEKVNAKIDSLATKKTK